MQDEEAPAKRRDPDHVEALARGLEVLGALADASHDDRRGRLTLTEVAAAVGLSRGTARRLLLTLRGRGFADTDGKRFWLTPKVLNFSNGYLERLGLGDASAALLRRLSEEMDETVSIGVLDGGDVVYVARVEVRRIYAERLAVGARLPAACSAVGRVLLARLSPDALDRWLDAHPPPAMTPRTLVDPAALRAELDRVRAEECALIDEEMQIGIRSCAVPILGRGGRVVAGLAASVSSARAEPGRLRDTLIPALRKISPELSASMDW